MVSPVTGPGVGIQGKAQALFVSLGAGWIWPAMRRENCLPTGLLLCRPQIQGGSRRKYVYIYIATIYIYVYTHTVYMYTYNHTYIYIYI